MIASAKLHLWLPGWQQIYGGEKTMVRCLLKGFLLYWINCLATKISWHIQLAPMGNRTLDLADMVRECQPHAIVK
jgi:hypothetical protein